MTCSKLRDKFLKTKSQECKQAYNKQRNLWKASKNYFNNLSVRNITDNKQFWKTVKPFFSNKVAENEKITLIEEDKVVSEDKEVAETFKSYFETLVKKLGVNNKFLSEEAVSNESITEIYKSSEYYKNRGKQSREF